MPLLSSHGWPCFHRAVKKVLLRVKVIVAKTGAAPSLPAAVFIDDIDDVTAAFLGLIEEHTVTPLATATTTTTTTTPSSLTTFTTASAAPTNILLEYCAEIYDDDPNFELAACLFGALSADELLQNSTGRPRRRIPNSSFFQDAHEQYVPFCTDACRQFPLSPPSEFNVCMTTCNTTDVLVCATELGYCAACVDSCLHAIANSLASPTEQDAIAVIQTADTPPELISDMEAIRSHPCYDVCRSYSASNSSASARLEQSVCSLAFMTELLSLGRGAANTSSYRSCGKCQSTNEAFGRLQGAELGEHTILPPTIEQLQLCIMRWSLIAPMVTL